MEKPPLEKEKKKLNETPLKKGDKVKFITDNGTYIARGYTGTVIKLLPDYSPERYEILWQKDMTGPYNRENLRLVESIITICPEYLKK